MAGLAFSRRVYRNTASFGELIVKGQVLSSHEKCPSQLDEHFASFRTLLHSWAPFYAALSARRAITLHWCWPGFTTHAHTPRPLWMFLVPWFDGKPGLVPPPVEHWLNLGPHDVYGRRATCWESEGPLAWMGVRTGWKREKSDGSAIGWLWDGIGGWEKSLILRAFPKAVHCIQMVSGCAPCG